MMPATSRPLGLLPLSCALLLSVAGCGTDEAGSGVVVVPFELGNRRDCQSLGIDRVRGELDDGFMVEEVDCEDGELRFDYVPSGAYRLQVFGLDADGFATMDSVEAGTVTIRAVGGGATVEVDPAMQLTAAPAELFMRWDFGFSSCESTGVDRFEIMAWRADGSQLLLETEVACDMPGEGSGQYRAIPDLERELAGDEFGEVSVQALDADGREMGDPASFVFETPGAGRPVRLSLSCARSGCDGGGELD